MPLFAPARPLVSPLRVFVLVILIAFVSEGAIMLVLPWITQQPRGSIWESVIDPSMLSLLLAPVIWWLVVQPLRNLSQDRGELLRRLFKAQEIERARLARDLHDELGQHLTAMLVGLKALQQADSPSQRAERTDSLQTLARTALDEARRLARGLRPAALDDLGLGPALARLAADVHDAQALRVETRIAIGDRARYSPDVEIAAYRIVQESLTNVARHARAALATVDVRESGGWLWITVQDDGVGLVGGSREAPVASLGLRSIVERAQLLGGSLTLAPARPTGTRVDAWLPAAHAEPANG